MTELPYAVVGGTAAASYMPKRFTDDLDVLLRATDVEQARRMLRAAGAEPLGRLVLPATPLQLAGEAWRLPGGTVRYLLWSPAPWATEAVLSTRPDAAGLPIIGLPYLILMKLVASRSIDLGDLSRILGGASEAELASVRSVVGAYLPEATSDLESLTYLGKMEFESEDG